MEGGVHTTLYHHGDVGAKVLNINVVMNIYVTVSAKIGHVCAW